MHRFLFRVKFRRLLKHFVNFHFKFSGKLLFLKMTKKKNWIFEILQQKMMKNRRESNSSAGSSESGVSGGSLTSANQGQSGSGGGSAAKSRRKSQSDQQRSSSRNRNRSGGGGTSNRPGMTAENCNNCSALYAVLVEGEAVRLVNGLKSTEFIFWPWFVWFLCREKWPSFGQSSWGPVEDSRHGLPTPRHFQEQRR